MASSPEIVSWVSSTPCSKEDLLADEKMKKRKLSNRESAKRLRIRKLNRIEELVDEVDQLEEQQNQLKASLNLTRQLCMNAKAEGSVIQIQMAEQIYRLAFLNEISSYTMSVNRSVVNEVDHQLE